MFKIVKNNKINNNVNYFKLILYYDFLNKLILRFNKLMFE